ncbi:carboxylating nicotinate-nucleotide diphosphorylase [Afifella marina]|uniref:Probable nicotinate-nucleotide pyrophosphorylase [carboxylating] n=1 Tax=Afifella marina DSM 2698 TaxID=1120955 RepID=A0A1G5MCL4_AFIMA|nr:carboxylating nicotinate-nucleotide diphosphorylase [Afifella marina]MBK1622713.1 nicotinate-nucleotide diphosphorylase (carboxylating) [Afifella marina DSM 2698]MBK1625708.1 nicotinate-nucleotide diphosphorylase (carboxylating) [Afifella marina]MBK5917531.1 nicotinate-nucleotide diphosphorylase (carboxylating) [Afifella marina]RAI23465.1 nicotinate-nucleotide diphosphorylase (carboxylating) [Afifella marina DSM 2698]SCZ22159.1 nicotinate-nucleotide pyrophosphorylase [carboxylating] [Afifel
MPTSPELPDLIVEKAVRAALEEDLGRAGDITSQATIPAGRRATATIGARSTGTLAGLALARKAVLLMDPDAEFQPRATDGDRLEAGAVIAEISADARALLSSERTALNFLCHLSGVATATAEFAAAIAHTKARITCTRKTHPGLRSFQKYAVRCGGGSNHRYGLDDAILIKDNHIAVAGGVREAIRSAQEFAGHLVRIEVEVDTLQQLQEALEEGPDVILLDNMGPPTLLKAVAMTNGRATLEASGGITLATVAAIAETGVDYISTGFVTHSAPILDLGLDIAL